MSVPAFHQRSTERRGMRAVQRSTAAFHTKYGAEERWTAPPNRTRHGELEPIGALIPALLASLAPPLADDDIPGYGDHT